MAASLSLALINTYILPTSGFVLKIGSRRTGEEKDREFHIMIAHTDGRTKSNAKIQRSCHLLQENQLHQLSESSCP
jgi:hypothetical protein